MVLNDLEFPSNVYPWLNLSQIGVETRMVKSIDGRLSVDAIADMIDARTRAVSISHVEYGNGFRNDLAAIGALCREKDVCFVVDAIQSLGQTPVDVAEMGIDILTADGHKWLLSPEGIGIFYCAPHMTDRLKLYEGGMEFSGRCGQLRCVRSDAGADGAALRMRFPQHAGHSCAGGFTGPAAGGGYRGGAAQAARVDRPARRRNCAPQGTAS